MIAAESLRVRTSGPRASVLVVEDERLVARDIERTLEDAGYRVTASVASGDEAIRSARENRPDVVLMDIHIRGGMDGVDAAELLSKRLRLPVVYLTAYSDEETLARAARTEPYGYVIKPFSSADLRSAIEIARQKHLADLRIAERERWFATTLGSIGDAVVACDAEERILFMNPVAEFLTGHAAKDAEGWPVGEVVRFASSLNAAVEHPVRRALRERTVQTVPPGCRLLDRSGEASRVVDDSAAPILYNGALLGAVLVFRDVTQQRQLEEQMAVTDRLYSLGVLAASVGHEINNPLTYNLANLSYGLAAIEKHRSTPGGLSTEIVDKLVRALSEAKDGAERIAKIVADLKVFSRAEQQALRRIDVKACIEWALRVTGSQIDHAARVTRVLEPMPAVMANEVRLAQVFVNLLENAAQAVHGAPEDNEIKVIGRTEGTHAVIEIRDSGPGIPDEVASRIFEPFFTTKTGAGKGLGLSICRDIVLWLGGTLGVSCPEEGGSCFRVTLPAAEDQSAVSFRPPPQLVPSPKVRVLVVDDDVTLGRTIHRILSSHEVTVVQSAHHALALVREERAFDVILCDLIMPDMSGRDFHDEVRRIRPHLASRVAYMTAGAQSGRTVEFLRDVNPRCLSKPFTAELLSEFVAECAGGLGFGGS